MHALTVALSERPCHAMRQTHRAALGAVVKEGGQQELRVLATGLAQVGHDVQPMALVGSVHGVEERPLGSAEPVS